MSAAEPPDIPSSATQSDVDALLRHIAELESRLALHNHEQHQARLQAEELSNQHRALLDNLPDLAWAKDLDGRFTAVNKAFAAYIGKSPEEIIGKLDVEFLPSETQARVRADEKMVIESRKTMRWERPYPMKYRKGWADTFKAPILDLEGNVVGVVGMTHDVTERKRVEQQLAESEKRSREFAEMSADWYWKQDASLRFVELKPSRGAMQGPLLKSLGLLRWEIPGVDLESADWASHKADLEARKPFRDFIFAVISSDRRRVWSRVSGMPIYDTEGNFAGYHGVGRDISAQMRATEELRITQERLELALNGSQLCIWDLDIRAGSIYLSEGWSRFIGGGEGPTQTTLEAMYASVHPEDLKLVNAAYIAAVRGDREFHDVEYRSRINSGEYRWLYSRGKVTARDANGRATRMSGTNVDIHERHTLQETLRKALRDQETLMETCPTGLAILRNRMFVSCNPAAERFLGYQPGELVGQSTRVLFSDDASSHAMDEVFYPTDGASNTFSREIEFKRKDGKLVWGLLSGHVIDATSNYGIFSLIDITSQRNLADALAQAKEDADSASRAKSGFLATMSHEIRTPMNGVLGMLELLELGGLEPSQRETVLTIRGQAHALLDIIDEILDFSKIEAGQLAIRPEPICIPHLVEQLGLVYQELASRKNLAFSVRINLPRSSAHMGDGVRIRQIIGNFLSNAVKFTDTGKIGISVEASGRQGDSEDLRICVSDTGIGISADDQTRLFQPFVQVDSRTTRRFGGTGLGLSICKRLAEAMGGTVQMESVLGKGTRMILCLTLPVTSDRDLPAHERAQSEWGLRPAELSTAKKSPAALDPILIAEDHVINLRLMQRQLDLLGYKTDTASNGVEALQKWKKNRYSLLITDCHMPGMDGYELTRTIRGAEIERGASTPLPIIACTADALAGDEEMCLSAGMSDYVAKPVSIAALQAKLTQWLPVEESPPAARGAMRRDEQQRPPAQMEEATSVLAESNSVPLDPRALLEFSGGDLEAEREILIQFLDANQIDSGKLLSGIDEHDDGTVLHTSHRIKGACRAIGASPLADICERIEKAATAGDWAGIAANRDALVAQRNRLVEHLKERTGQSVGVAMNPQNELPFGIHPQP
jgi:PAS domain S-box-containing protein